MASVLDYINILAIKVNKKTLPASYIARIIDLEVDEKESHATEIAWQVAFIENLPNGVDDPFCKEKDSVELTFGWLGRMSRKHSGKIYAIDGPALTAGAITWTIKMRDNSTALSGHATRRGLTGKAADIILDICTRRGLTAYLPTAQGVVRAVNTLGSSDFPEELKRVFADAQAHSSDRKALQHIADRTGHHIRVDGNGLYFDKPDYAKGTKRDYVWRDGRGLLLEFKPASKTEGKHKGKAIETSATAIDKDKRAVVKSESSDATEKGRPVLGKGGVWKIEDVRGKAWQPDTTGHIIASPDPAKAADHARTGMTKAEATPIQGTAEVVGDPTIERGAILRFIDIGQKNSGHWRVVNVKHKVGAQGFKTSLGMHRHGHSKAKDKNSGKVNETRPGANLAKAKVAVRIVNGKETRQ